MVWGRRITSTAAGIVYQQRCWHTIGMPEDDYDRLLDEILRHFQPDSSQTMAKIRQRLNAKMKAREKRAETETRQIARLKTRSKILPSEAVIVSREDADTLNKILDKIGKRGRAAVVSRAEILANAAKYLGSLGGKKGGSKGGKARMAALTDEGRSELGRKAAAARWKARAE
jgi:hypothetical protein